MAIFACIIGLLAIGFGVAAWHKHAPTDPELVRVERHRAELTEPVRYDGETNAAFSVRMLEFVTVRDEMDARIRELKARE